MKQALHIFALACLLASNVAAQETGKRQLIVPLPDAGFVAFRMETVPANAQSFSAGTLEVQAVVNPEATVTASKIIHRTLVDNAGSFVFGYDLVIEAVPHSKQFKVSVRPLSPEFEQQLRARLPASRQRAPSSVATLSKAAEAQVIDDGDAFALDLLVNPETGVKIVDVVKVSFDRSKLWEAPQQQKSPARDFTVDRVELAVRDYELLLDGVRIAGGKPTRGTTGALLWLYVPGRGRFIFSLIPREGYDFQKVGVVEDTKISFTYGGKSYEWISSEPIVGRGGNWNLWVLLDAGYVPEYFPSAREAVEKRDETKPKFPIGALERSRVLGMNTAVGIAEAQAALPPKLANGDAQLTKDEEELTRRRARVQIGSADRIENLLPKN